MYTNHATDTHCFFAAHSSRTSNNQISAKDIDVFTINAWSDLIELGDKGMLEPVDNKLGYNDHNNRGH